MLRAWLRFRGEAAGPLFTRLDTLASDLLPMTGIRSGRLCSDASSSPAWIPPSTPGILYALA